MTTAPSAESVARPLRADAERNRLKIIAAARTLFAERGLEVSLDDVAAAAGVGVGTVYRRFANRDELIRGVFVEHLRAASSNARQALDERDPWVAVVDVFTWFGTTVNEDRGLAAIIMRIDHAHPEIEEIKRGVTSSIEQVFDRAQAAGVLRPDLRSTDLFALFTMLSAVSDITEPAVTGSWRRYLELLLDAIHVGDSVPLTTPALTEEQLRAAQRRRALERGSACAGPVD